MNINTIKTAGITTLQSRLLAGGRLWAISALLTEALASRLSDWQEITIPEAHKLVAQIKQVIAEWDLKDRPYGSYHPTDENVESLLQLMFLRDASVNPEGLWNVVWPFVNTLKGVQFTIHHENNSHIIPSASLIIARTVWAGEPVACAKAYSQHAVRPPQHERAAWYQKTVMDEQWRSHRQGNIEVFTPREPIPYESW